MRESLKEISAAAAVLPLRSTSEQAMRWRNMHMPSLNLLFIYNGQK